MSLVGFCRPSGQRLVVEVEVLSVFRGQPLSDRGEGSVDVLVLLVGVGEPSDDVTLVVLTHRPLERVGVDQMDQRVALTLVGDSLEAEDEFAERPGILEQPFGLGSVVIESNARQKRMRSHS